MPPDHLFSGSALNLGPHTSRWEINKFENCWYKSVRILEVLELLFQQFMNLSSSQRDMSDPILGDLSNNGWSGDTKMFPKLSDLFPCIVTYIVYDFNHMRLLPIKLLKALPILSDYNSVICMLFTPFTCELYRGIEKWGPNLSQEGQLELNLAAHLHMFSPRRSLEPL
jgi:hypothetical protein